MSNDNFKRMLAIAQNPNWCAIVNDAIAGYLHCCDITREKASGFTVMSLQRSLLTAETHDPPSGYNLNRRAVYLAQLTYDHHDGTLKRLDLFIWGGVAFAQDALYLYAAPSVIRTLNKVV